MPELHNLTPYPNFRYYSRDSQDREFGVVVVKATYEFDPSGRLVTAEEQAPMVFTDKCHGAVNLSSLWHPSDLVPHKPATDLIINAVARTPDGRPQPTWECGIEINSTDATVFVKKLRVTGPREWRPVWKRALNAEEAKNWPQYRKHFRHWELSEPEPVSSLPLHYEYAYGGEVALGRDDEGNPRFDTSHYNPLGRGKIDRDWTDHTVPVPAPQIESVDDLIADPYAVYVAQGLGPIPPAWLPRRPLGGTYDQNWIDTIWPAWPTDYSFAYHNSAHPDLIISPYLAGGEEIVLTGLAERAEPVRFRLPREQPFVEFTGEHSEPIRASMALDTVFLDIVGRHQHDWRVFLSWRVNFPPDVFDRAIIQQQMSPVGTSATRLAEEDAA